MKNRFLSFLASVTLSLCVFLIFGEIIIRIEGFIKGGHLWTPDKYLHIQHIPNTTFLQKGYYKEYEAKGRVNNWGFIGKDVDIDKGKDTKRIIVFGDSFTEAVQVDWDKNYCTLLEGLLKDSSGKCEVINAGISDYSPRLEYLYLREKLIHFKPDYLILQLFANDIYDDSIYKDRYKDDIMAPLKKSFFYSHSRLYHYTLRQRGKLLKKFTRDRDKKSTISNRFFFIIKGNERLKEESWRTTESYLLKMKELSNQEGIELAVFVVPVEAQVSPSGEMSKASQFYFDEKPTDDFDKHVEGFCRREGLDYIDMLSVFRDNAKSELYFEKEGHLTEEGHRVVSDTLFKYLKEDLL